MCMCVRQETGNALIQCRFGTTILPSAIQSGRLFFSPPLFSKGREGCRNTGGNVPIQKVSRRHSKSHFGRKTLLHVTGFGTSRLGLAMAKDFELNPLGIDEAC
ncbi:hypothetical protein NPIL_162081 [Nephila pilipes]|uniref:Uncharacterized protein n=1 Tax=Nephila pilipes TaxID=299642 RepID=A0A8X6PL52_NEPPI|nr:hypothetical protein NPIL_162081 [Nephila pilipes]